MIKDDSLSFDNGDYASHLRDKQRAKNRWDNKQREKQKNYGHKGKARFDDDYECDQYGNYYGGSSWDTYDDNGNMSY